MPKVGNTHYAYTKAGKKAAARDAKKKGVKVVQRKPAKRGRSA